MGRKGIPIWLHTSVDDVLVGVGESLSAGIVFVIADKGARDFLEEDIASGKIQALRLHIEYADPEKPRNAEQIDYLERQMRAWGYAIEPYAKRTMIGLRHKGTLGCPVEGCDGQTCEEGETN